MWFWDLLSVISYYYGDPSSSVYVWEIEGVALYFSNIILKSNQTYYHNNIENSMHHNYVSLIKLFMCTYIHTVRYECSYVSDSVCINGHITCTVT